MMGWLRQLTENLVRDMQFAWRGLRESPLFAAAALLTLTLGIAANTTIFSVTNAVLLNSLPFRHIQDPDSLVMIWERSPQMSAFLADRMPVRLKDVRDWRANAHSFADIAVWREAEMNITGEANGNSAPERISAGAATANLFGLMGAKARMGRLFDASAGQAGAPPVTVISDELYTRRFARDPQIVGKTLRAGGVAYSIVGVLPPGFELPAMWGGFDQKRVLLWIPLQDTPGAPGDLNMDSFVYARLRQGVPVASARAEMQALQARLAKADPALTFFSGVNLSSVLNEDAGPDLRSSILVLQAAVGFVLLIACANVANLLLTRAISREREFAVRLAVGAGRLRLLQQMLTESLLLSFIAGAAGSLLAFWGVRLVAYLAPRDTHGLHELQIDGTVLAYTLAVTVGGGILFGLAPFLHVRRQDMSVMMNRTSRSVSGSSSRFRAALAITELALSVVLLVGAGLMVRTLWSLMSVDLGFHRDHLLSAQLTLPDVRYGDRVRAENFNRQLLEGVRSLPGVRSAMVTTGIPMQSVTESSYELAGRTLKLGEHTVSNWARVSDGYFETLGMQVVAGRTFTAADKSSGESAVAVVNRAFARLNDGEPQILGRAIRFDGEDGKPAQHRIVGVVQDERQLGPESESHAEFYLLGHALRRFYLLVRTSGDPMIATPAVKEVVAKLDRDIPVAEARSMDSVLQDWTGPRRFLMSILITFAALAMVLSATGLFAVLAYSVSLRTREIGIRLALGAEPRAVSRGILWDGCKLTAAGIAAGLAGSFALSRFLQGQIFGVDAADPLTFAAVALVLAGVALLASYAPARRAAGVDPIEALRVE